MEPICEWEEIGKQWITNQKLKIVVNNEVLHGQLDQKRKNKTIWIGSKLIWQERLEEQWIAGKVIDKAHSREVVPVELAANHLQR